MYELILHVQAYMYTELQNLDQLGARKSGHDTFVEPSRFAASTVFMGIPHSSGTDLKVGELTHSYVRVRPDGMCHGSCIFWELRLS